MGKKKLVHKHNHLKVMAGVSVGVQHTDRLFAIPVSHICVLVRVQVAVFLIQLPALGKQKMAENLGLCHPLVRPEWSSRLLASAWSNTVPASSQPVERCVSVFSCHSAFEINKSFFRNQ